MKKYLLTHDYIECFIALQPHFHSYCTEIEFLRNLIMSGQFSEAATFLTHYTPLKEAQLIVYRAKFNELIHNPDEKELKVLMLEELPSVCSQEQYQQFLKRLVEQRCPPKHTFIRERYQCFEAVLQHITQFSNCRQQILTVQDSLQTIVQEYFFNQQLKTQNPINNSVSDSKIHPNIEENHPQTQEDCPQKIEQSMILENSQMINKGKRSMIKQNNVPVENMEEKNTQKEEVNKQICVQKQPVKTVIEQNNSIKNTSNISYRKNNTFNEDEKKASVLQKSFNRISSEEKSTEKEKSKIGITGKIIRYDNVAQSSPLKTSFDKIRENVSEITPAGHVQMQRNFSQIHQQRNNEPSFKNNFTHQIDQTKSKFPLNLSQKMYHQKKTNLSQKRDINIQEIRKNIEQLQQSKEQQQMKQIESSQQQQIHIKKSVQKQSVVQQDDHFTFDKTGEDHSYSRRLILNVRDGKAIRSCQWSVSGELFAVGTNSSVVRIFKCLKPNYTIEGIHLKSVFSVDWSHNQNALVTCSNDQSVRLTSFDKQFTTHKTTVIGQHQSCVRMALFNSDESKIYSCGDDSTIKIWDTAQGKRAVVMRSQHPISAMSRIQHGLYSVGKDEVQMWDVRSGKCVNTIKLQSELTSLVVHTDRVVCAHKDGQVSFLSSQLDYLHSVQVHEDEIRSINSMVTPTRDQVYITGSFDGHVAIFGEKNAHNPTYFRHNQEEDDKVVYATFMKGGLGYASTSTLGHCNIYTLQ